MSNTANNSTASFTGTLVIPNYNRFRADEPDTVRVSVTNAPVVEIHGAPHAWVSGATGNFCGIGGWFPIG